MSDRPAGQGSTTSWLRTLIGRVRTGDGAALNHLLLHVEGRLRALTSRLLRDYPGVRRWEETDDVLQQALLRLHRSLQAVELVDLNHFLRLAALQIRRELLTLARRYRDAPPPDRATDDHSGGAGQRADRVTAPSSGPDNLALWTEFHEQVDRLPVPQREVFDLVFYHDLSQVEAAEILQVSERTVRSRWHAARLTLVDKMEGRLPGL